METQGDFVQSLAAEVRAASFTRIEDLLSFVNWLDEELSFLVCPLLVQECEIMGIFLLRIDPNVVQFPISSSQIYSYHSSLTCSLYLYLSASLL